jgi:two-component system phosphate regulon sensor histidine kinase PhoR
LRWRLFSSHFLVLMLSAVLTAGVLLFAARRELMLDLEVRLSEEARLLARLFAPVLAQNPSAGAIGRLAESTLGSSQVHVLVLSPDGRVLGHTENDFKNYSRKLIPSEWLTGGNKAWSLFGPVVEGDVVWVSAPVVSGGRLVGAVGLSVPLEVVNARLRVFTFGILGVVLLATACAALLSLHFASALVRPLRRVISVVGRIAEGDLSQRAYVEAGDEVGELARNVNAMAEQLGKMLEDLAVSESTMRTVVSGMTDGIILTDPKGTVVLFNQAAERALGIRADQALGRTVLDATLHMQLSDMVKRALNERKTSTAEITLLYPQRRVLSAFVSPVETDRGIIGSVVVFHDLTETRRVEQMRREFIANASHELKTPLASIKLMVESLLAGAKDDPEVEEQFLSVIASETDRLVAIVEDMLQLSAIEAQETALRREEVSLCVPLQRVLETILPRLEAKSQKLTVEVPSEARFVGDAEAVERVLANLLDNAVKYTPDGGSISVAAEESDGKLVIKVADTGIGIPEEHQSRIFERFYRVDKARSRALGGTGLGLSIVKHLVEAMGGSVAVESTPGCGSTFTVVLPAAETDAMPACHKG